MQPSQDWSAPSPPPLRPVATSSADSSSAFSSAPSPRAAAATTGSRPPPTQLPAGKPRSFRNSGFSLSLPPPTPATGSGGQNPFDLIGSSSGAAGGGISGIVSSDGQGPLGQQQHQQNPWAHLMASSGAPTPAIKGALSPFTFGGASEGPFAPPPPPKSSSPRPPTLANGKRPAQQGVFSPDVKAMRELSLKEGAHGLPGNGNGGGFAQHQPFTLSGIPGAGPPGRPPHQRVPSANGSGQGALAPPAQSSFRLSPPGGMPSLPGGRVAGGSVAGGGRIPFGSGSPKPSSPIPAPSAVPAGSSGSASVKPVTALPATGPSQIRLVPPQLLPSPMPSTYLLLDLRTHALFTASRLQGAIPVTIPSTLLRRPNFTLAKLIPMLDSEADRSRVLAFKEEGKVDAVIVYDQDGSSAADNGTLVGLLAKFRKDGFGGELWAVKGGFLSILRQARAQEGPGGIRALVDEKRIETSFKAGGTVNGRELPLTAFQSTSTATSIMSPAQLLDRSGPQTGMPSHMGGATCSCPPGQHLPQAHVAQTPAGQYPPSSGGWDSSSPMSTSTAGPPTHGTAGPGGGLRTFTLTPNTSSFQAANPFFDNIRQNVELSHGGITERIPLDLPQSTIARAHELPSWLRELAMCSEKEAAERLAAQFEAVERGELRRLQGVMSYHARFGGSSSTATASASGSASNDGATDGDSSDGGEDYFPYSITAGLEKGQKNRFRNIWPFDHARVRLADHCVDDGSDYINASFIQPRTTHKRYIATQGPLPSTYRDFWTVCWEQNVRVIVMLTKQHEGGQVKCGDYWSDRTFGPLTLHPIGVEGAEDLEDESDGGGGFSFFSAAPPSSSSASSRSSSFSSSAAGGPARPALIKRSFHLSHADHPDEPDRLVTQIQYVSWPDFDIPESPADLLSLIHQVNELNDMAAIEAAESNRAPPGPTVVHCSAGVGRTGSYVVVDAVLDAVKRQMAGQRESRKARQRTFSTASSVGGSGAGTPSVPNVNPPVPAQGEMLRPSVLGGPFNAQSPRSQSGSVSPNPPPTPPPVRRVPSSCDAGGSSPTHGGPEAGPHMGRRPSMDMPAPAVESGMEVDYAKVLEDKARLTSGFPNQARDESAMSDSSIDVNDVTSRTNGHGIAIPPAPSSLYSRGSVHNGSQTSLGQFGEMNLASSYGGDSRRGSVPHLFASSPSPHFSSTAATPNRSREGSPTPAVPSLPESDVPRNTHRPEEQGSPTELAELRAPIFSILADMRQQRMSLCQTLRQYVFVYRVVFQGVLDIIDEERRGVSDMHHDDKKRQASPTNIQQSLSKRPSIKLPKSQGRPRRGSTKASLGSIASPNTTSSGLPGPVGLPLATDAQPRAGVEGAVSSKADRQSAQVAPIKDGDQAMT